MEILRQFKEFIDPTHLIQLFGYPGLTLIVFLETGAMVFFLPGDSLLFVAGLFAGSGELNIFYLWALLIPAAIVGDAVSYFIGSKLGPALFNKPESRFFKPAHMKAAHDFYEKHGGKAIIMARFMPIVRTFVPVVAGIGKMPYQRFAMFNAVGGLAWVLSMTIAGYFLGQIEFVKKNLELMVIGIVFLSILPAIIAWLRGRK
ncbi:MAG: VTT domain-containing protein [Archangium sp.]|nr:VTT domain-containing protein [Archangium sp.]MDP3575402.1 VTT domain-containing protein [Archangium sp.]